MTDFLSDESKDSLNALIAELNSIYPCWLNIIYLQDSIFKKYDLKALNGNYLAYYRLLIGSALPKDLCKILYLDVDMLVLGDLRALFTMDLNNKVCGAVLDYYSKNRILKAKDSKKDGLEIGEKYFNSGFMIIDLEKWRALEIEKECLEIAKNYYCPTHDQDILNAVLLGEVHIMPLEWNLLVYLYCNARCANEGKKYNVSYFRDELNFALKNPKILHFYTDHKPWSDDKIYVDSKGEFLGQYWWDMALKTPIFREKLAEYRCCKKESQVQLGYFLYKFYKIGLVLVTPLFSYFAIIFNIKLHSKIPLEFYNISYEIGKIALQTHFRRKSGRYFALPFKICSCIKRIRYNQMKLGA